MAADINDKFKKVSADNSYAVATTVKTARTVGGGTTLEAFDLSKWADATAVNFLTYRKTTDPVTNITTVTNRTGWTALVNTGSNTLTNLTVAPGYTDLGHQEGDYIEPVQMSKWANDLVDGILVTHNQDGTLKNKVATLGKINGGSTDGVLLTDASGNVTGGKVTASNVNFTSFRLAKLTRNTNTTNTGTNTSPVAFPGLTVTFTLSQTRTVRANLVARSVYNTSTAYQIVNIYNGSIAPANVFGTSIFSFTSPNQEMPLNLVGEITLGPGTYTFNVGGGATGGGTGNIVGTNTTPIILTVDVVS